MTDTSLRLRVIPAIAEVDAAAWDACANPAAPPLPSSAVISQDTAYNPFISYDFLHALEASGSATGRTGWQPQHVIVETDDGILGVVPCYLKSHSRGEYVFDRGWAEAYERAGGEYYPKLQVSVPFTPATGRRLLVPPGPTPTRSAEPDRRPGRALPAARGVIGAFHVPARGGMRFPGAAGIPAAHRPAIPLGERRLRDASRRSSRRSRRASARPSAASAATRSAPASACIG